MALLKNVYDKDVPTGNLITTISGFITLVLSILVGFGVVTPDQSTEINQHAMVIVQAVVGIWGAVTALILIFKAKDA